MQEVVDLLDEYGWSDSVSNLSGKLQRGSLRYREAVELADVLGYDVVWQKRRCSMTDAKRNCCRQSTAGGSAARDRQKERKAGHDG